MGMQTSPHRLLMSRGKGTLGAQTAREDTYLLKAGFNF